MQYGGGNGETKNHLLTLVLRLCGRILSPARQDLAVLCRDRSDDEEATLIQFVGRGEPSRGEGIIKESQRAMQGRHYTM